MTWDQYWYEDVWMVEAFRKADELRQQRMNAEAWWQGAYFYDAVSKVIANVFKKKGQPSQSYPSEPYKIGKQAADEEAKKKQEEYESARARLYMQNMIRAGKGWHKS